MKSLEIYWTELGKVRIELNIFSFLGCFKNILIRSIVFKLSLDLILEKPFL